MFLVTRPFKKGFLSCRSEEILCRNVVHKAVNWCEAQISCQFSYSILITCISAVTLGILMASTISLSLSHYLTNFSKHSTYHVRIRSCWAAAAVFIFQLKIVSSKNSYINCISIIYKLYIPISTIYNKYNNKLLLKI